MGLHEKSDNDIFLNGEQMLGIIRSVKVTDGLDYTLNKQDGSSFFDLAIDGFKTTEVSLKIELYDQDYDNLMKEDILAYYIDVYKFRSKKAKKPIIHEIGGGIFDQLKISKVLITGCDTRYSDEKYDYIEIDLKMIEFEPLIAKQQGNA